MTKKTIHLTDQAEKFIKDRTFDDSPNFSAHINSSFDILSHLAQAEKPNLTNEDWVELYNVYAGSDLTRLLVPLNLASDFLTHYGIKDPSQLSTQHQDLLEKLVSMTQAQRFATLDAVRLFLSSCDL